MFLGCLVRHLACVPFGDSKTEVVVVSHYSKVRLKKAVLGGQPLVKFVDHISLEVRSLKVE